MIARRNELEKQLEKLDSAVRNSFANLKHDFQEQQRTIQELKARIIKLEQKQVTKPKSSRISDRKLSVVSNLSPLHLQILKNLMVLQLESGRRNVSMKDLALELYPQKKYRSIKTTLSKYIDDLHGKGLIEKMRNYRLYISYTEKALRYADSERISRMKELISQTR